MQYRYCKYLLLKQAGCVVDEDTPNPSSAWAAGTPAEEAETSLFVEPLRWMSGALQLGKDRVVSGKLSCPGCAARRASGVL